LFLLVYVANPPITTASPVGSGVTVGYQRPRFIGAQSDQAPVAASKRFRSGTPTCALTWPPATIRRPSDASACPPQKMLVVPLGTAVKDPPRGSHR
jgi:hypothetical protein